ncbi:MAG: hypothetical protein R3E53_14215 [Myxococcota bacterium]
MLLTVDLERLDVRPGHRLLDAAAARPTPARQSLAWRPSSGSTSTSTRCAMPSKSLKRRGREVDAFRRHAAGRRLPPALRERESTGSSAPRSWSTSTTTERRHGSLAPGQFGRERADRRQPILTATSEHLYLRLGDEYFESPGGHIRSSAPDQRGPAAAGFDVEGCGFAHGFHTPYCAALRDAPPGRGPQSTQQRLPRVPDPGDGVYVDGAA